MIAALPALLPTELPAALPSPTVAVWHLGPLPVRAYALCIIAGIVVAVWIAERRFQARGGRADFILDMAVWAVPFGIVGARIYHVVTSPQAYFGEGGDPVRALKIWDGGLGIWGAIAAGVLGAWIAARRAGYRFAPVADAAAPALLVAQALGRWGNWFNNELYGRATDLPWALTIHRWDAAEGRAVLGADGAPEVLGTFHPTFLYESLWCLAAAVVLVLLDRRYRLRHGQVFLLYVVLYCAGRSWFEALRIDDANHILGLRVNTWVAAIVLLAALAAFAVSRRRHRGEDPGVAERVERESAEQVPSTSSVEGASPSGDDASVADEQTVTQPQEQPRQGHDRPSS
ncbi:prolipoprotein diacylglyceryl transferase [Kineococcus rubinsiae]|uniref:prolipoprotein diacylglyceryl transferase n=1 Tax=Kineococcus rubinsiae TaxID=2609562 RepID=UPI001430F81A|nr:prolipoprotein diacylglyceryl transferase [Kineococcus rubinsiae]NIZ89940.1 prolipoprotein diacylglyceryl transferase [Kineococcus rubinsiae]